MSQTAPFSGYIWVTIKGPFCLSTPCLQLGYWLTRTLLPIADRPYVVVTKFVFVFIVLLNKTHFEVLDKAPIGFELHIMNGIAIEH